MRVRAYYSKTYTTAHEAAAVSKFRIPEFALRRQLDLTPELFEEVKSFPVFTSPAGKSVLEVRHSCTVPHDH